MTKKEEMEGRAEGKENRGKVRVGKEGKLKEKERERKQTGEGK